MMLTRAGVVAILITGLLTAGQADESSRDGKGTQMSVKTIDAREQLARFDSTKDPLYLENAIRDLEQVDLIEEQGQDRQAARREVMILWLASLAALQKAKDPTFDPNDRPKANMVPAPGSSGRRYPSGIDPKAIPEPDVRAQYEAALAKNRQKAETYRIQYRLRFLEERVQPGVDGFIGRYYSKSSIDRGELRELVERTPIPQEQKQRLLAVQLR